MSVRQCAGVEFPGILVERCGALTPRTRCPRHQALWERLRRPSFRERGYDADYERRRGAAIKAEPWCHYPGGCRFPDDAGTPANPLTAEHVIAMRHGGQDGPLEVWCKRDNSAWRRLDCGS